MSQKINDKRYNIVIEQNATFSLGITIKDGNGVAWDLTNYTAAAQARLSYDGEVLFSFTTTIDDAANGHLKITLTAAETAAFTWSEALYDVVITSPAAAATRVIEGGLTLSKGITA